MSQIPPEGSSASLSLARILSVLSSVLLVVFIASVFTAILPSKPFDPQWQLELSAVLINNATLALIGALLLPMATYFNPGDNSLRLRSHTFRRWALAAAVGFLLLIPLQIYAGWTFYRNVNVNLDQQNIQSSQKLQKLRQAVIFSTTPQELQAELKNLLGQNAGLSLAELRTPMPVLRQQLLARAEQTATVIMRSIEAQSGRKPPTLLVKETIRVTISALAYGVGFMFLAGVLPRGRSKRTVAFGWGSRISNN